MEKLPVKYIVREVNDVQLGKIDLGFRISYNTMQSIESQDENL